MEKKYEIELETSKLIRANGYEGISISKIAKKCGIAKATVYHHFKSKENLLGAVLMSEVQDFSWHVTNKINTIHKINLGVDIVAEIKKLCAKYFSERGNIDLFTLLNPTHYSNELFVNYMSAYLHNFIGCMTGIDEQSMKKQDAWIVYKEIQADLLFLKVKNINFHLSDRVKLGLGD